MMVMSDEEIINIENNKDNFAIVEITHYCLKRRSVDLIYSNCNQIYKIKFGELFQFENK